MLAVGVAQLPEEEKQNHLLKIAYCFAGAMITADGAVSADERELLEQIANVMELKFDWRKMLKGSESSAT